MKVIFKNKALLFLLFLLLGNTNWILAQNTIKINSKTPFTIGETLSFTSTVLGEERILNIYLPQSYQADSSKLYPVIYLLDGSQDEDFIHIAGLVQFGSFPWINLVPESIVVGIANVDRKRDFTSPSSKKSDLKHLPTSGKSALFIQFLKMEVLPLIQSQYRTEQNSTLIGQSLGGLLGSEILAHHRSLFDRYVLVSPSLWWNDGGLLNVQLTKETTNGKVFIAVGKEGALMENGAKTWYEKVKKASNSGSVKFHFYPDKNHGDALHEAVYDAFLFFNEK